MTTAHIQHSLGCPVQRQDLDKSHDQIRQRVGRAQDGLFGPKSMMWKVAGPTPVVPLMLLEAGLLESPHPIIAYGTLGSQSANDFVPRYHRSADAFYDWFFGDLDTALKTARRVFGYHSRIKGELPEDIGGMTKGRHYDANEQDVLIWVWATIIRPLKEYHEAFMGPLTVDEVDRYYEECRHFALLFGIDQSLMPATWRDFITYFDTTANSPIMELSAEFLSRSSLLSGEVSGPISQRVLTTWVLSICARRLPTNVRRQYPKLPSHFRHRMTAGCTLRLAGRIWPHLPTAVQQSPRHWRARRRVGRGAPSGHLAHWVQTKLPPPYGLSYREAGISLHGKAIRAGR